MPARNVSVLILYNADGKLLLQHRTKDAPTFPDYWAFFGGGIEEGESPKEAVMRESLEELGYALTSPVFFRTLRIIYKGNEHTIHVFSEMYKGGKLILGEGQGMGWYAPHETRELLVNDHDRLLLEQFGDSLPDRLAGCA